MILITLIWLASLKAVFGWVGAWVVLSLAVLITIASKPSDIIALWELRKLE